MEGEAEWYEGVNVTFISGRTAVMTVFQDGKELEQIVMSKISTKQKMHKLMVDKGFKKKSPEVIAKQDKIRKERQEKEEKKRQGFLAIRAKNLEKRRKSIFEAKKKKASERERERELRKAERELLGKAAPSTASVLQFYGVSSAVLIVVVVSSNFRKRRRQDTARRQNQT